MRKQGPRPTNDSDESLGLFLLGWFAGKCRSDECPIRVDRVEASSYGHLTGSDTGNKIVNLVGPDGSYDTHFDVVTHSGVRLRVEVEVVTP